jgi:hypothetical protein
MPCAAPWRGPTVLNNRAHVMSAPAETYANAMASPTALAEP